jgi:hypothetical protein
MSNNIKGRQRTAELKLLLFEDATDGGYSRLEGERRIHYKNRVQSYLHGKNGKHDGSILSENDLTSYCTQAMTNGHTELLDYIKNLTLEKLEHSIFRKDPHPFPTMYHKFARAMVRSGYLRIGEIQRERSGRYTVTLYCPNENQSEHSLNSGAAENYEWLVNQRTSFSRDYNRDLSTQLTPLPNPVRLRKSVEAFTTNDLQKAYGLGIAHNIAQPALWRDHMEHFSDLTESLPPHIRDTYQAYAAPWLASRRAQKAGALEHPVQGWAARVKERDQSVRLRA